MNSAGQGHAWAQAIARHCPDTSAANFTFEREKLNFPADYLVPAAQYRHDTVWADEFRAHVKAMYTSAILESNVPLFGGRRPGARADIRDLEDAGLNVALMAHGSDVRIPSRFNVLERWSPFPDLDPAYVATLERKSMLTVELFTTFAGRVFVSTPSLLSFVQNASWSPVVVQPDTWVTSQPPLETGRRPVVLHAPSNSRLKASGVLDPVLAELDRQGRIHYRRVSGVPQSAMPELYRSADIVVDQLCLADYGVAACEAMAAGRIVFGHISEQVRQHVRDRTSSELPIIEMTPENISEVICRLLDDPDSARRTAALGPAFVRQVHDGRLSAEVFAAFLADARHDPHEGRPVVSDVGPTKDMRENRRKPKKRAIRGRVVMLVDNNVTPDSRVQKEARSAAELGWDVTLLGQHRPGSKTEWAIGKAKVRLLTFTTPLSRRHHLRRSGRVRSPLAYSRPVVADYREQLVRARRVDLKTQQALLKLDTEQTPQRGHLRRARMVVERAQLALQSRWTGLRAARTRALDQRRQEMVAPVDRLTTAFWHKAMGRRSWRQLDPNLWDWELAYGPVIDQLKPDIIHANDFRMLGVGARAKLRALGRGRDVRLVWDAHEFLPGMRPWNPHPRWHIAQRAHEREYARHADAVVTVSEPLASLLDAEHGLAERPTVVLNAPDVSPQRPPDSPHNIRRSCKLEPSVPLMVYSGSASPPRGLVTMVEALAHLPLLHAALVVSTPNSPYVKGLLQRAAELGVRDRLHLLPYVPVEHIVAFLSSADVGVIPIQHFPNHEISLITKFLEYSHARLPIVVSDVKAMSETVRRTGQGEVFVAEDVTDFVRAVSTVLADRDRYRSAYDTPGLLEQWTWKSAADTLDGVYTRLRAEQRAAKLQRPVTPHRP